MCICAAPSVRLWDRCKLSHSNEGVARLSHELLVCEDFCACCLVELIIEAAEPNTSFPERDNELDHIVMHVLFCFYDMMLCYTILRILQGVCARACLRGHVLLFSLF